MCCSSGVLELLRWTAELSQRYFSLWMVIGINVRGGQIVENSYFIILLMLLDLLSIYKRGVVGVFVIVIEL